MRRLLVLLIVFCALPARGMVLRREAEDWLWDFSKGAMPMGVTFTRASDALNDQMQPAVSVATDVPRLTPDGIVLQGVDVSPIIENAGDNSGDVYLRWLGASANALRAFYFEDNCNDSMGVANGTPTDEAYADGYLTYGRCIESNGSTTSVNAGSGADIDTLTTYSIAFLYCADSAGGGTYGRVLDKGGHLTVRTDQWSSTKTRITATLDYLTTDATSQVGWTAPNGHEVILHQQWAWVVVTYDEGGDRKIHIYVDGKEPTYVTQTASVGVRANDDDDDLYLLNNLAGDRSFDGKIDNLFLWGRVLTTEEMAAFSGLGCSIASSAMITFSFDDGCDSDYTRMLPVFTAQGEVATSFIVTGWVGAQSYMTWAQIEALDTAGWEIAAHSVTHANLGTASDADCISELYESQQTLMGNGYAARNFAWPGGAYTVPHARLASRYYDSAAGYTLTSTAGSTQQLYWYHREWGDAMSLAELQTAVDDAETGTYWLVINFHRTDATDAANIDTLIDYIQAKLIPIVTVEQALDAITVQPQLRREVSQNVDLYAEGAVRLVPDGSNRPFYQTQTLTAVNWVTSALVYTDGSAVTSADCQLVMAASPATTARTTTFEHLGNGVYLASCVQLGTAASWNVGVETKVNRTLYISGINTHIATVIATHGGDYPRTPIMNSTTSAKSRAAEYLTAPGTGTMGATEGTVDWEGILPADTADVGYFHCLWKYYLSATNRIALYYNHAGGLLTWYVYMNGATVCSQSTAYAFVRGDRLKTRLIYKQPSKIPGSNYYAELYADNGSGWAWVSGSMTQPDGTLDTSGTIFIGEGEAGTLNWNGKVSRMRIFREAKGGLPTW